jgi:hypothetical protein
VPEEQSGQWDDYEENNEQLVKLHDELKEISNNPDLLAHATSAPPQTVADKASAVGMKSALKKLPGRRRVKRERWRKRRRMTCQQIQVMESPR